MRIRRLSLYIIMLFLLSFSACSKTQPTKDAPVQQEKVSEDNKKKQSEDTSPSEEIKPSASPKDPFAEDLLYLKSELPKRHKNPFAKISEEEFNTSIENLIRKLDQLNDDEKEVGLGQIIASIGDAHTNMGFWDGYSYPLEFTIIDGDVYVINAVKEFKEMLYSKVTYIDGVDMKTILEQLTTLIPHENDSWVVSMLSQFLESPAYLYGLDLIKDKTCATFTVEKDGTERDYSVAAVYYTSKVHVKNKDINPVLLGEYDKNYTYEYLSDSKAMYFQYNVCREMEEQPFQEFTDQIADYTKKHPEVKLYILIGRKTFSGGMFAIYRTKDAAPNAVLVGESTGGALDFYAEVKTMELPNTCTQISYSTQYYEFTKEFHYKNKGVDTCEPDVVIQPTIDDYQNGKDPALEYTLKN